MKMFKKYILKIRFDVYYLAFILIFLTTELLPQTVQITENRYNKLQLDLKSEQGKLDSLKNVFNERVKKIDEEKNKQNPDKDAVKNLMAGSISLTNEIDVRQKKVDGIEGEVEKVKKKLNRIYSEKIDSLQEIERRGNISSEELNHVKEEVISFVEKKIATSPKASLLSFNPEKIAAIDLKKISDQQEKEIYKDYLQKALAEVDSRLENINESISEVRQIIILQKKTNRFLEETEFETNIQQQNVPETASNQASPQDYSGRSTDINAKASFSTQAQDYSLLLGQLRQPSDGKVRIENNYDLKNPNLTLPQYQDLLKEVKKKLLEYKLIIAHKLGAGK